MPDARCTRGLVCKIARVKNAHEHTGQRRTSDIPCAMVLRLIARSPRSIRLSSLRRLRKPAHPRPVGPTCLPRDLTPTTEAPGPHVFTVRFGIARPARSKDRSRSLSRPAILFRARCCRVHRIPSQRSVTMANAPSSGTGWRSRKGDLPDGLSGILPDGLICRRRRRAFQLHGFVRSRYGS